MLSAIARVAGYFGRGPQAEFAAGLSGPMPAPPTDALPNDAAAGGGPAHVLPAMSASFVVHLVLIWVAGAWFVAMPEEPRQLVEASFRPDPIEPAEPPQEPVLEMADPSDTPADTVFSAEAMSIAPVQYDHADLESMELPSDDLAAIELPPPDALFGFTLDPAVYKLGSVGEAVDEVEGAVDRITYEISKCLEESPVLVVWMMDQSISVVDDREQVAARLERIYDEMDQLGKVSNDAVLSAVVAFGQGCDEMVAPTKDGQEIVEGIRNVPVDDSGIENVFASLIATLDRYKYHRLKDRRKVMVVVWTDESGNDYSRLEDAVVVCRRMAVPVFTVGPSAMFGLEKGTHAYLYPDDGQTYMLPIDRGPDAVRQERIHLPYWFEGDQLDTLTSGLGPFALTRLAAASGGAYLINDADSDRSRFDVELMARYAPEYISPADYVREAQSSPLRGAILRAVDITHQRKIKGTPQLRFAPTGDTFQNELREAQELVAYNVLTIDGALAGIDFKKLEEEYQNETVERWRAWYDLTYGRLLAMKVRCDEYNWACAVMKGKGSDFVDKQSNRWTFRPSEKLNVGSSAEARAKEAIRLLERCVEQNPGTPWETLAQRELRNALGFEVVEEYEAPPPPPRMDNTPVNNQVVRPRNVRRTEQLNMLQRQGPPPNLPKL